MSSWFNPKTEKRMSQIHGRGLFAVGPIAEGEIVAVKGGSIVDGATLAIIRAGISPAEIQIEDDLYIAPLTAGEVEASMLHLNHSCDPNVGVRGQITFVAMRDVSSGSELTIDYAMIDGDPAERMPCSCGTPRCRKVITGNDWRLPELRRRYMGHFSRYIEDRFQRPPEARRWARGEQRWRNTANNFRNFSALKPDGRAPREHMSALKIHREMKRLADPSRAAGLSRFFKTAPGQYGEGDRFLGIRVPVLRTLAAKYQAVSHRELSTLLGSPWHEERLLALLILVRQYSSAEPAHRESIYRLYMSRTAQINNWDLVDCSAEYIVGAHLRGGARTRLRQLARSKALWERRIAILATFHYIKQGEFDETLRIARLLRDDPHDLIHKAVGWMLREVGKRNRAAEEAFLRQHATRMPRTMLRYAIERFPERLRRQYLAA